MFGLKTFTISLLAMGAMSAQQAAGPVTKFGISVKTQASSIPTVAGFAPAWQLKVGITLSHKGPQPLTLEFPSGQTYDIAILNDKGERIYVWSADKLFLQAMRTEKINEKRVWTELLPIPLSAGRYTVEAFLTTAGGIQYRATQPVELTASSSAGN
jgi:hypothetical protein